MNFRSGILKPNTGSTKPVTTKRVAIFLLSFCLNWSLSAILLWWTYDMDSFANGGAYSHNRAFVLVVKMGLIITLLTTVVWAVALRKPRIGLRRRAVWSVGWKTALILLVYALMIEGRRLSWTPAQGNKAFSPILNDVNSEFFREFLFLIFVLEIVPIMGCISGILYSLQVAVIDPLHRQLG
jgi:hypothetical protein